MEPLAQPEVYTPRPAPQPFPTWLIITLALMALLAAGAGVAYALISPIYQTADPRAAITVFLVNGQVVAGSPAREGEEFHIPLEQVKQLWDANIRWEPTTQQVIITTADKVIDLYTGRLTAFYNSKPVELSFPVTLRDGQPCLPLTLLAAIYKLKFTYFNDGNVLAVESSGRAWAKAKPLAADAPLRRGPNLRAPILARLPADAELAVLGEEQNWLRVLTERGVLGYVAEADLTLTAAENPPDKAPLPDPWLRRPLGQKVSLVWEHVLQKTPSMDGAGKLAVNVVSPTWFSLADGEGKIHNLADPDYVRWAHSRGYDVWALFSNSFKPDITHAVLQDPERRRALIKQLLAFARLYSLDGINLDFENMGAADRDLYSQFVRELAPYLREQNLVVSVDVTVSAVSSWSVGYDRHALGEAADFVAVMTYDEHWSTSPTAGSVASLPWVERGVKALLAEVPAEKLLLGIPYYTRVWQEQTVDGKPKVTSSAVSMAAAERLLSQKNAAKVWDEAAGQNYFEYRENGSRYRVWLEDEQSLKARLELARKYRLAGAAYWRRGFEKDGVWDLVNTELARR